MPAPGGVREGGDDGVLALEGGDELRFGVGVADAVDGHVRREGRGGGVPAEDGDGEVRVAGEGGEDARAEVAAGAEDDDVLDGHVGLWEGMGWSMVQLKWRSRVVGNG